jgi:enoyl-CoA hydratase/carnithine racemase
MTAASGGELKVERLGAVTRFTLDRPHAMNSYSSELVDALNHALDEMAIDPDQRVLIVAGSGKAFCCGADLKYMAAIEGDARAMASFLRRLNRFIDALDDLDKPVIAQVNGLALGGGLETMLACDIIVAADTASIADPHITIDAVHGAGGSQRLVRAVGLMRALDLALTARPLTAAEAQAWGIVSRVVPQQELAQTTLALAQAIAARDALVTRDIKRLVRLSMSASRETGLASEHHAFLDAAARPGFVSAMARFANRKTGSGA